jgi:hypothetical protein
MGKKIFYLYLLLHGTIIYTSQSKSLLTQAIEKAQASGSWQEQNISSTSCQINLDDYTIRKSPNLTERNSVNSPMKFSSPLVKSNKSIHEDCYAKTKIPSTKNNRLPKAPFLDEKLSDKEKYQLWCQSIPSNLRILIMQSKTDENWCINQKESTHSLNTRVNILPLYYEKKESPIRIAAQKIQKTSLKKIKNSIQKLECELQQDTISKGLAIIQNLDIQKYKNY